MSLLKDNKGDIPTDLDKDFLGQRAALETLKTAIENIDTPACIALYGSWGAGKTTLMHAALNELGDKHKTVWFDPWLYERHDDVVWMLLISIMRGLGTKNHGELLMLAAKAALTVAGRIGPAAIGTYLGGKEVGEALKGFNFLDPADLAKKLTEGGLPEDDVEKLRKRFAEVVRGAVSSGQRVVVFLDDLDRCLPDEAVRLIEAVKLLLAEGAAAPVAGAKSEGAPVVFVFGLDRQIIGEAILNRFPKSTLYTGENYLEKIFDLSLEAPPFALDAQKLKNFIESLCGDILERAAVRFQTSKATAPKATALLDVLKSPVFANPRVLKRVINRLQLLLTIEDKEKFKKPDIQPKATICLAWIAGTERFRTFRHFFVTANRDELEALDGAVKEPARAVSPAVRGLIETPGFIAFYRDLLELGDGTDSAAKLGDAATPKTIDFPPKVISNLRDLDNYLRRLGL